MSPTRQRKIFLYNETHDDVSCFCLPHIFFIIYRTTCILFYNYPVIMKTNFSSTNSILAAVALAMLILVAFTFKQQPAPDEGYIIDHEHDIKKEEPGSHNGGGNTTAYPFFSKDKSLKIAFRKRILHPGSSIGYHLQKENEIYYILSGKGILKMNGNDITVSAGDAILTKPGSSHGLKPAGNEDLAVLITYNIN